MFQPDFGMRAIKLLERLVSITSPRRKHRAIAGAQIAAMKSQSRRSLARAVMPAAFNGRRNMPIPSDFPDRFLRTSEAAMFLSLFARTLEKHRVYGIGPRYLKLSGRVIYKAEGLKAWAERGSRSPQAIPALAGYFAPNPI